MKKAFGLLIIVIVFLAGYFANSALPMIGVSVNKDYINEIPGILKADEIDSPYDHIKEDQIKLYDDMVVILLENPEWASFADTNSMDPLLDYGSNAIEIVPESTDEIHVGDIVSYNYGDYTIVHRVIEISEDEEGWYCRMKGDNNPIADSGKVRFEQIKRIVVGVIY